MTTDAVAVAVLGVERAVVGDQLVHGRAERLHHRALLLVGELERLGLATLDHGVVVVDRGDQKMGRHLPVNPSGGVLNTNPIGASGMLRFGEAALQVMGRAGEHQVGGVRNALGHAYGGGAQYFSIAILSTEL